MQFDYVPAVVGAPESDSGFAFGHFLAQSGSSVTRRITVLVLDDGRGNGDAPNTDGFAEISRRAGETIRLTSEPRNSWPPVALGLPLYTEYWQRIRVVRDLTGPEGASGEITAEVDGR